MMRSPRPLNAGRTGRLSAKRKPFGKFNPRPAIVWLGVLAAGTGLPEPVAGQGRNDTIAQTNQSAPGGNGVYNFFAGERINASGQVAFSATLNGTSGGNLDNNGVFLGDGTNGFSVFRKGSNIPTGPGVFGDIFGAQLGFNNQGQVFAAMALSGTSGGTNDDTGIFRGNGVVNTQLVREGQSASGNGTFGNFFGSQLMSNSQGQAVFINTTNGSSGGTTDNVGLFAVNSAGSVTQVARRGQAVTGGGTISSFVNVSNTQPGVVTFSANLSGTPDTFGIFRNQGGVITQVARSNQAVPGGNGLYSSFTGLVENNSGQLATTAVFTGTSGGATDNQALLRFNGTTGSIVARRGDAAHNGNGAYSTFSNTRLGESGHLVFQAQLSGTAGGQSDDFGLFLEKDGVVTQIAREGQTVPGGNGVFSELFATNSPFFATQVNKLGLVAFTGRIGNTGVGAGTGIGVYIGDGQELLEIAREGASTALGAATSYQISDQALNDQGQVVYRTLTSTGGSLIQRWTPTLHWRANSNGNWEETSKWTLGIAPSQVHDVALDTPGSVTVQGPQSATTIRTLQVGGSTGVVTFRMQNGTALTTTHGVTVANKGILTGDGVIAGNVTNLAGGQILAENLTVTGTLSNHGVVRGSGLITGSFVNEVAGQLRANQGDHLRFAGGTGTNLGRIEVINGHFEMAGSLANAAGTGLITGRNAMLRWDGGLQNAGSLGLTFGTSDVFGDIVNAATGQISISGGANATFYDDVLQNGTLTIAKVGNVESSAVIFGSFTGSGGFVGGGNLFALGDLRPGNSPASILMDGNLFLGNSTETLIELGGTGLGEFDQLLVTGNLELAGALSVSLINGFGLSSNQMFLIGDIGGNLSGQFAGLSEGALIGNFGGTDLFLTYQGGDGNDLALFTAVPEPGSLAGLAVLLGTVLVGTRRRRV